MFDFLANVEKCKKKGNIIYESDNGFNSIKTNFPVDGHDVYYNIEDNSFWFSHRIKCLSHLIEKYIEKGSTIVDLGGGNGYNTKVLQDLGYNSVLMEPSLSGCKNADKRGVKNIILNIMTDDNLKNSSVDNVTMFDVLECVMDEKALLTTIYNKLKKDGCLVVVVPAFNILWSQEDVDIGNVRRFEMKEFEKILEKIGFTIEYKNYLFSFLFLPILFIRSLKDKIFRHKYNNYEEKETLLNKQHNTNKKGIVSKFIELMCDMEYRKILYNKKIPFGSSIVIVAKK